MGRPLRIEYPGALYHLTSRGNEKKSIFLDKPDRERFLHILVEYRTRHGIVIHAYVLMDNHYHLLLETPRGNLLKVMHGINSAYTGYFNRKYERVGHLFQGRYRALLVDKDQYLISLSRYIHLNPVRAQIVKRPEEYAYSSYGGYIGRRSREDWVDHDAVLCQFGRTRKRAEENYWKYVSEAGEEDENLLRNLLGQTVLGGEAFMERIKDLFKGKTFDSEVIARKEYTRYPGLKEIVMKVAAILEAEEKKILTGESKLARDVALYLIHRYSGLSNKEIGKSFGKIHSSSVSQTVRRLKEKMGADKELAEAIQQIESSMRM